MQFHRDKYKKGHYPIANFVSVSTVTLFDLLKIPKGMFTRIFMNGYQKSIYLALRSLESVIIQSQKQLRFKNKVFCVGTINYIQIQEHFKIRKNGYT